MPPAHAVRNDRTGWKAINALLMAPAVEYACGRLLDLIEGKPSGPAAAKAIGNQPSVAPIFRSDEDVSRRARGMLLPKGICDPNGLISRCRARGSLLATGEQQCQRENS